MLVLVKGNVSTGLVIVMVGCDRDGDGSGDETITATTLHDRV